MAFNVSFVADLLKNVRLVTVSGDGNVAVEHRCGEVEKC